jgi:membrane associated rhomboid family serine protease
MAYATTDEHDYPRITPAVQWLIALNVAIFFVQLTLFKPADVQSWLGFRAGDLPAGWWKALTYMFVHGGFLHLAGNMYMLWLFGPRIEHQWSSGSFARFYVLCGLGAWLTYLLLSRDGLVIGASGAVYGVMLAYAVMFPDSELFFFGVVRVKVKWLVAAYIGYDLIRGMTGGTAATGVAYWAHVGGALTAWLYLRLPSAQGLGRLRERISQVPDIPDETPRAVPRSLPRPRERASEIDEIVAKSKAVVSKRPAPLPAAPKPAPPKRADELNLVLDKISEQGLDSLTSDERRLLEEMSRRLRNS